MNRNIWHLLPLMNIELNENAGLPLSRRFHVHTQLRKLFMLCSPESHHTHTDIHYYHNCQMDSHLAHDHSSHYSISLSMKLHQHPLAGAFLLSEAISILNVNCFIAIL